MPGSALHLLLLLNYLAYQLSIVFLQASFLHGILDLLDMVLRQDVLLSMLVFDAGILSFIVVA